MAAQLKTDRISTSRRERVGGKNVMAMESISLSVDLLRDRASGVHLQEVNVLCLTLFLGILKR